MCGINGIIDFSLQNNVHRVASMNKAMAHRGRNNEGIWKDEQTNSITLGHRRLSIIDLSSAGNQPMHSHDGRYVLVFNGEIYNYKSLQKQLDYPFKSDSDSEVILAAFAKWGIDCVKQLEGMFAFALWDNFDKKLFLVRDRLGIKPLYYYRDENKYIFSSEMRSMLASGLIPKHLDQHGLEDFLRYQTVHAPRTMIENVRMLLPAHYVEISETEWIEKCYWQAHHTEQEIGKDYKTIKKDIYQRLNEAVEKRLVADVPFGAFLSGGIDSSIVVGLMSKMSNTKVKTFCVSFDEEEFSEAKYAKLIANRFGTEHHDIRLHPKDFLEVIPNALSAMDHPSGDGINTYIVSKVTKEKGIDMVLSGLGGDELFAGYDLFKMLNKFNNNKWIGKLPVFLKSNVGKLRQKYRPSVASDKLFGLLSQKDWKLDYTYPLIRQVFLDERIKSFLKKNELSENRVSAAFKSLARQKDFRKMPFLSQISVAELFTYLQNVLLRDSDQMSMAHTLEIRVPFLDYKLIEYVLQVPDSFKYPHSPKKLLVDSVGELLPSEIVNRQKMGFTLPWQIWLKNELFRFCDERIESLASRPEFNYESITKVWRQFLDNDPRVSWARVWNLVVLENWLQEHGISTFSSLAIPSLDSKLV
ncbi:asparagine synthase (glutamine-hydrolyzing) [Bernardetia sp.]|uniref:asparagine synthase (glutamine-hydrolyzing) n=1 Tax=Bernardetia sp. TaxID=1937974 RepID=UPI0025BE9714|nr:asparagine synthase (glutamine-hydrolyzing) [Bernardetia sp.]